MRHPTRITTATMAALLALVLTGCGGSDMADDDTLAGLHVTGHGAYPDCPADPLTFVGPLLPQCLDHDHRREIPPVHCTDEAQCHR